MRIEIKRLLEELKCSPGTTDDYSAKLMLDAAKEIELMAEIADHPYVKEMGRQIDELEDENARLRAALRQIATTNTGSMYSAEDAFYAARDLATDTLNEQTSITDERN